MDQEKILVTGKNIQANYNRTLIILNGLKRLGYDVIVFEFKKKNKETSEKIKSLSQGTLFTFLPSFTHKHVRFVKKHSSSDVVFDPLISKYMTNVKDYKSYPAFSYGALRSSYRDKVSLQHSDFVIFDTKTHRDYFLNRYKLDKKKTGVVYVGANSVDFRRIPPEKSSKQFTVGFIGHFIPLHGIFNILKAAQLLRDNSAIKFELIGTGFHFNKAKKFCTTNSIDNVEFLGQVNYEDLNRHINNFDLCLGIFGNNIKANHVIPNKIFNYASCGRAVLTMETTAIKEIFEHNKNIYLTLPAPEAIAESILHLSGEEKLREQLGENIYKTVDSSFNEEKIALSLLKQYREFKENQD